MYLNNRRQDFATAIVGCASVVRMLDGQYQKSIFPKKALSKRYRRQNLTRLKSLKRLEI